MQTIQLSPMQAQVMRSSHRPAMAPSMAMLTSTRLNAGTANSVRFGGFGLRALGESISAKLEWWACKLLFMSDEQIIQRRIRKHTERKEIANQALDLQVAEEIKAQKRLTALQTERQGIFDQAKSKRELAKKASGDAQAGLNKEATALAEKLQAKDREIAAQQTVMNNAAVKANRARLRHSDIQAKLDQYQQQLKELQTRSKVLKQNEKLNAVEKEADRLAGQADAGGDPIMAAIQDNIENREAMLEAGEQRTTGDPTDMKQRVAAQEFERQQKQQSALDALDAEIAAGSTEKKEDKKPADRSDEVEK
jgi:hypothetical protein